MKKIFFLLFITFAINSCSLNDEPDRDFVLLPVESVTIPDNITVGNISVIKVKYRRPTQCHIFDGFYYDANGTDLIVAIRAVKLNQNTCPDDSESLYEMPLNFQPKVAGIYTFKFWLGADGNGVDQYAEYDVEVQ